MSYRDSRLSNADVQRLRLAFKHPGPGLDMNKRVQCLRLRDGKACIDIGVFSSSTQGSGVALDATNTGALKVFCDDDGEAIGSGTFVKPIEGRILLTYTSGNREQEAAGVLGKIKSVAGTNRHNMCGVMGSYEVATSLTVDGQAAATDTWCQAAVIGRVGAGTSITTIAANGVLAGVAAMSNTNTGFASNSGVYAAFYAGAWASAVDWAYGLYLEGGKFTTGIAMGSCTTGITITGATGYALQIVTSGQIKVGTADVGIPTLTATPFGFEMHTETGAVAIAAGSTGLTCGLRCRYQVSVAQTQTVSFEAVDARLRVKANMAGGCHSGVCGTIESDGAITFTGIASTQRSAGNFCVELGESCVFGSTSGWVCGVTIDSSIHATQTGASNVTMAGLRIKKASGKLSWQYGLYMDGVVRGYYISADLGTMDGEMHGESLALTGTLTSGDSIIGKNIAVTTAGTAGMWAAGIFARVTQGSTKNVNGYICGAEFEVVNTCTSAGDWFPLVLNGNSNDNGSHTSYIALRDYGTADIPSLFWAPENAIRTTTDGVFCSTVTADPACTHVIRCIVGTTTLYLMATTDTPAD